MRNERQHRPDGTVGNVCTDPGVLARIIHEPAAILDARGHVRAANKRLLDLTGLSEGQMADAGSTHPWWSLRGWETGEIAEGEFAVTVQSCAGPIAARCDLRALPGPRADEHHWLALLTVAPEDEPSTAAAGAAGGADLIAALSAEKDALLRVARAVANGATPDEVFALVAREVAQILRADAGIVWRFVAEGSEVVGTHGSHESQLGVVFPTRGDGAVAVVARTGRPARARYDTLDDHDPTATRVTRQGYTSGVAAPLSVNGTLWGAVLAATTDSWEFPDDAESRLGLFAELASLAIANAQARQDLALRATVDHLTEALNQGEFHRRIESECGRALRHGRPLSLVVFDLDHFKRVNDGAGHQVGDRVLRATARAISAELRGEDLLARVGGEEFALILPETGAADAAEAAERVRLAVARIREPGLPPVTISAGVAELADAPSPERLFAAADRALYAAKRTGRNRVCHFDPSAPVPGPDSRPSRPALDGMSAIRALALAVEAKDSATREHSERVADLVGRLAAAAGWPARRIDALRESALVHDVGKIGVPDRLLLKRGPLTRAEYDRVKIHPSLGADIAAEVLDPEQASWVRHHHERYDGAGYPAGLIGEGIPDGARLLAVADAFDVMTTGRRYARARTRADVMAEIRALAGTQFCPAAVSALECVLEY